MQALFCEGEKIFQETIAANSNFPLKSLVLFSNLAIQKFFTLRKRVPLYLNDEFADFLTI
jgi:hypothetical protein